MKKGVVTTWQGKCGELKLLRATYVESNLNTPHFSSHQRFGEVDFGVPQLRQEREAELARCVLLQDFL